MNPILLYQERSLNLFWRNFLYKLSVKSINYKIINIRDQQEEGVGACHLLHLLNTLLIYHH